MAFMLLTPLDPTYFAPTRDQAEEFASAWYCRWITSTSPAGELWYIMSPEEKFLANFLENHDLEGIIIEFNNLYDNIIQEEVILED